MKYVHCNYCGYDDTKIVNHGPDLLLNRPGDYYLVRCCNCGLIYQNPQLTLEELSQHYPESYSPYQSDFHHKPIFQRLDTQYGVNRRCKQLMHYQPDSGKLLDVGCATGLFLNEIRRYGWEVAGVELSDYAAEYARQTFQLPVLTGPLEQANFPSHAFDVVTLWDVFEHVIDPKATLTEVHRVLKPDGLLALSLPNPLAFEAALFGANWVGWDRPRHLHLFTPDVLQKYLKDAGFHLEAIDSLGGRLGLTLLSVEFWFKSHNVPEKKWQPWTQFLYNRPFRLFTWPFYRLGEWLNKTTVMNVFARRT